MYIRQMDFHTSMNPLGSLSTQKEAHIMGLNFRKSFTILPGVKVNLGKKSASISIGKRGARHTISTTGKRTTTIGIPGTGLSYTHNHTSSKKKKKKKDNSED